MILVAGGRGFIGTAVTFELLQRKRQVAVLSHCPNKAQGKFEGLGVDIRAGDVRNPETLESALVGCEAVIDCVQFSWYPVENPRLGLTFEQVDHQGTVNLAKAAEQAGVKHFIYLSAAGVGPDAKRHWYRAKWGSETAVRESSIPYTIFKPTWVIGPGDRSLNIIALFSRFLPFAPVIGDGKQRLQPVYVTDLSSAICDSLEMESARNRSFEVAGPDLLTMDDVARTMTEVQGRRKPIIHFPPSLFRLLGAILQLAPIRLLTTDAIDFMLADALGENRDFVETFGVQLTGFREGLMHYLSPTCPMPSFAH